MFLRTVPAGVEDFGIVGAGVPAAAAFGAAPGAGGGGGVDSAAVVVAGMAPIELAEVEEMHRIEGRRRNARVDEATAVRTTILWRAADGG